MLVIETLAKAFGAIKRASLYESRISTYNVFQETLTFMVSISRVVKLSGDSIDRKLLEVPLKTGLYYFHK